MKNRKLRILTYLLALLNLLLAAGFYQFLPDKIPMSWSFDGTASYDEKWKLFMMCGISLLLAVLFDVLPKIDPRRGNYEKFGNFYDGFCVVMQIFMLLMTGIVLTEAVSPGSIFVPKAVLTAVGLLLLFIGNMMPKFKSNFYCGIKTPWSLSSEEVWRKTHRLGGKCFCLAGLLFLAGALLPLQWTAWWLLFACVMAACLIPGVMSYVWWRQEQKIRTGQDGFGQPKK